MAANNFYSKNDHKRSVAVYSHMQISVCMKAGTPNRFRIRERSGLLARAKFMGHIMGFAKIQRGVNTCGIASSVSYPINIIDPEREKMRDFLHDINSTGAMCLDGSPTSPKDTETAESIKLSCSLTEAAGATVRELL